MLVGFAATLSVCDALAFRAENRAEKETVETALLLAAAAKWAVMTGMVTNSESVGEGFMALWYMAKASVDERQVEGEREDRRSRMIVAIVSTGIQGTVS